MTIPKILHCIWVGDAPPPHKWIFTWRQKHWRWRYILWDNEKIFERQWENQRLIDHYRERKDWPGVADVARYEILHEMGGAMHGADSECLHNIEPLFDHRHTAYAVYENEKVRPGYVAPLYACTPGHPFARLLIDGLKDKQPGKPWQTTGNLYMKEMIATHQPKSLMIWPSYTLIPEHFTGVKYRGPKRTYARQHFGSTRGRGYDAGR